MVARRSIVPGPFPVALLIVGLLLSPLLVGIEPVGGDPDLMYRPIKFELAQRFAREDCRSGVITSERAFHSRQKATSLPFTPRTGSSTDCSNSTLRTA